MKYNSINLMSIFGNSNQNKILLINLKNKTQSRNDNLIEKPLHFINFYQFWSSTLYVNPQYINSISLIVCLRLRFSSIGRLYLNGAHVLTVLLNKAFRI